MLYLLSFSTIYIIDVKKTLLFKRSKNAVLDVRKKNVIHFIIIRLPVTNFC